MTCWIGIFQRIVQRISISIERRRIPRIGYNGIRLDKAPQRRVVPACSIVVQAQADFLALTGVAVTGDGLAAGVARATPRAGNALRPFLWCR